MTKHLCTYKEEITQNWDFNKVYVNNYSMKLFANINKMHLWDQ